MDIGIFWLQIIGIGTVPQKPTSVGPYLKYLDSSFSANRKLKTAWNLRGEWNAKSLANITWLNDHRLSEDVI